MIHHIEKRFTDAEILSGQPKGRGSSLKEITLTLPFSTSFSFWSVARLPAYKVHHRLTNLVKQGRISFPLQQGFSNLGMSILTRKMKGCEP